MVSILKNLKVIFLVCLFATSAAALTCTNSGSDPAAVQSALNGGGAVSITGTCAMGSGTINVNNAVTVTGGAIFNSTSTSIIFQINSDNVSFTGMIFDGAQVSMGGAVNTKRTNVNFINNTFRNYTQNFGSVALAVSPIWVNSSFTGNICTNVWPGGFTTSSNPTAVQALPSTLCIGGTGGLDHTKIEFNSFSQTTYDAIHIVANGLESNTGGYGSVQGNSVSYNTFTQIRRMGIELQGQTGGCVGGCGGPGSLITYDGLKVAGNYYHTPAYPGEAFGNTYAYSMAVNSINFQFLNNAAVADVAGNATTANGLGGRLGYAVEMMPGFGCGGACGANESPANYQGNYIASDVMTGKTPTGWFNSFQTYDNPTGVQTIRNNLQCGPGNNLQQGGGNSNQQFTNNYTNSSCPAGTGTLLWASNISTNFTSANNQNFPTRGTGTWAVAATSTLPIRNVRFFLDGSSTPFSTQEIQDLNTSFSTNHRWNYSATIDTSALSTGAHAISASVTDVSGAAVAPSAQTFTVGGSVTACTNNSGTDPGLVQNKISIGGTVTVSGTCNIGTTTLNMGSNTIIQGSGSNGNVSGHGATTATVINYSGSGFIFQSPGSNNTITGLTLNGGGIFLNKNDTAHHTGQSGWTITNNTIQNTTSEGVRADHILGRDSPNNHSNISNNQFTNINNWGVFWGSGIDNTLIDNNFFTGINLNPLKGFNDWFNGFIDPYTATNIKISNNDMQQFHRIAFENQGTVGGCPGGCNSGQVWSTGTIISGNFIHNFPANADRNVWGYSLFWGAATQVINNTVVNNKIVPTNLLGIGYEWAGFDKSIFQGNVERANSPFVVAVTTGFTSIGGVPCSVATCTVTYANNIFINNPTPLQTNPIYGQGENQLAWDQVNYVHKPDYISGTPGTISEASSISLAYTSPDHQSLASGSSGTWNTSVVSNLSIRSMQFFLDGSSTAAATQQVQDINNNFTIDQKWLYHATINTISLTNGSHTIVARATDVSGAAQTQTQTFTVGTGPSLINTFTASPSSIAAGSSSNLAWSYSGTVTSASIDNGVGNVFSLSSISVSPTATTTYILTAVGPSGTFTATATVTVAGGTGPLISTFGASPASIAAGGSSTLSWTYSGTVTAASIDNGVGSVLSLSSISVTPGTTTTYTLTATGPSGTATATTTVAVSVTGGPGTPQPAAWPTVATNSDLLTAADHSTTTLSSGINSSTLSIPVVSASTFIPFQVATVDSEQMKLCAVTTGLLTVCTSGRGFAGTSAAAHSTGASVNGRIVAVYHNQVATELSAIEAAFLASGYGSGNTSINGAAWRSHAASSADLLVATDGASATLAANISPTSTIMTLTSPQFIVQNQVVTMDGEEIKIASISGPTYTIVRGWDNTQPVPHNAGALMLGLLSSTYWNVVANDLVALEGNMWGLNGSTPSCPCAPVAGASWPNHAVTLAELGVASHTVTISAASQMRLIAEFIALETDIHGTPAPTLFTWPLADSYWGALVNVNTPITSYLTGHPSYFTSVKLATDLEDQSVDYTNPSSITSAGIAYTAAYSAMTAAGMITGNYISGTVVSGTQTQYPYGEVLPTNMPGGASYCGTWPGQAWRSIICLTDAPTVTAFEAQVKVEWQAFPAPLRFVDNAASAEGGPIGVQSWTAQMSNISALNTIAQSIGSRAIFNVAFVPGLSLGTSDMNALAAATVGGGVSTEQPFDSRVSSDPVKTTLAIAQYRQLLDAGTAVVMIATGAAGQATPQQLAIWVSTWRHAGDHLYLSQPFFTAPDPLAYTLPQP